MSKHTPGPWKIRRFNREMWILEVWSEPGSGGGMIATCGGERREANAALIEAAPELLAAAVAARRWIDAESIDKTSWQAEALDGLDAAIAKAEGQPILPAS